MPRVILKWAVSILVFLMPISAHAIDCQASISDFNFGTVDVLSTNNPLATTTATATINCDRNFLEALFGTTATVCLNIGPGSGGSNGPQRTMISAGNLLSYNIFSDPNGSDIIGHSGSPQIGQPERYTGVNGTQSVTLYGRITGNQPSASTGTYISAFTTPANAQMRFQAGNQNCSLNGGTARNLNFTVTTVVTPMCLLEKPSDLNFGSRDNLNTNTDATTSVKMTCTRNASYSIALSNGLNGARNMRMDGGSELVRYELYRDMPRTQSWSTGANAQTGLGSAGLQSFTVYGRIPTQTTPAAGTFTDTVTVTVTF